MQYTAAQARRYLNYWRILRDHRRAGLGRAHEVARDYLRGLDSGEADKLRHEFNFPED